MAEDAKELDRQLIDRSWAEIWNQGTLTWLTRWYPQIFCCRCPAVNCADRRA